MILNDFDHFKNDPRVKFKDESVNGKDVVIINYMIADDDFWKLTLAKECRGHVFDKETGKLIGLGFEKFFNINEKEETQIHKLNFDDFECYTKVDASMIQVVEINGFLICKTKKSFYSEVAIQAQKEFDSNDQLQILSKSLINLGYSPIFEFYSPDWKIVIDYGNTCKFTLLAARNFESLEYMDYESLLEFRKILNFDLVDKIEKPIDEILKDRERLVDYEGYVIKLKNGMRVKYKTLDYLNKHKIFTELRERDVVEMILDETIDDIKGAIINAGENINKIVEIENLVSNNILNIINELEQIVRSAKDNEISNQELFNQNKDNLYIRYIMMLYKGCEIDYLKLYKKYHLKDFGLKCLYNMNFGESK